MRILIIQTCDGKHYKPFLDLTQERHEAYCNLHGYEYMRYDGIFNGINDDPSFATFNRIYLLQDVYKNKKHFDWVFYIDADCIIKDINKSVDEFLDNDKLIVACRGASDSEENTYDVNIGVAFYNMRHPKMNYVLDKWQIMFESTLNLYKNINANTNNTAKLSIIPIDFIPNIYLELNPDVAEFFPGLYSAKHYIKFGINENRIYKYSQIPEGFSVEDYCSWLNNTDFKSKKYISAPFQLKKDEYPDNLNFSEIFDLGLQPFDDQSMLHSILLEDATLAKVYIKEKFTAFNYNGSFVEQLLRSNGNTVNDRIEIMKYIIKWL